MASLAARAAIFSGMVQDAKEAGISVEGAGTFLELTMKRQAEEVQEIREIQDARAAKKPEILRGFKEKFTADPNAEIDPGDVAVEHGLENNQGNRAFVAAMLRIYRATTQKQLDEQLQAAE